MAQFVYTLLCEWQTLHERCSDINGFVGGHTCLYNGCIGGQVSVHVTQLQMDYFGFVAVKIDL